MNWAYEQRVGNPSAKSVLIALANQANDKAKCWPGIEYIVKRTEFSRRSVITHLQYLDDRGFISRTIRPGDGKTGRKSNVYQLLMLQSAKFAHSHKVQDRQSATHVGQSANYVGQSAALAPKQSINSSKNTHSITSPAARFDEWYVIYPRKAGKSKALKIWQRDNLGNLADKIIEDTRTRSSKCQRWQNKRYIPNPANYLNDEGWQDDMLPLSEPGTVNTLPRNDTELEAWALRNGHRQAQPGESYSDYRGHLENVGRMVPA